MDVVGAENISFEPARFVLGERLSVVNFARALDIDDPTLRSSHGARRGGYSGRPVTAPMYAFFQTVTFEELETRLGFRWGRTLGAGMDFEAGVVASEEDEIIGQSMVESAWESVGGSGATRQFLRLRTDFRHTDGTIACRWRVLFIERIDRQPDPAAPRSETVGGHTEPVPPAEPLGPAISAEPGRRLPEHAMGTIDRLRLARVSVAIDNPDPLHIDDAVAQAAGFPSVIGQGSGAVGLLYEPVRRWAGIERVIAGSVRLTAPYSLGTTLTATGEVLSVDDVDGRQHAHCETRLRDSAGSEVASAQMQVLVS